VGREVLAEIGRRTLIMGILNVTPDSFSDGGRYTTVEAAVAHAQRLVAEGADILDIGGESTRPGADPVPLEEELRRVLPVVRAVRRALPEVCLSVDTYKARVAAEALEAGADLINDVSALRFDPEMARVVAQAGVPVVLMHMKGTPKTMQQNPTYQDVVREIVAFLRERIEFAVAQGIARERILVDPGIGFGKRPEHNTEILRRLGELRELGRPILLGTSRKSFLGALTKRPVEERLEETIASVVVGVLHGADIVRVHDVAPLKPALAVADAVRYDRNPRRPPENC
jgi:dihydropteroate synthase